MKRGVEQQVGDFHAAGPSNYGAMGNTDGLTVKEREMWFHSNQEEFLAVNEDDSMLFPNFPLQHDFACMLSSPPPPLSFSSSTPAPAMTTSLCSPYSDAWAALKTNLEEDAEKLIKELYDPSYASIEISQPTNPSPLGDSMETFGCNYNLLGSHDFFDPAVIFQNDEAENENPLEEFTQEEQQQQQQQDVQQHAVVVQQQHQPQEEEEDKIEIQEEGAYDDELRYVFLEWLRTNKDIISANDLRSVKLNKATIEAAAKRLGRGKEGVKQLLKLVLEWVQRNHLQNKRTKKNTPPNVLTQSQDPTQYQNTNPASNLNPSSFGPAMNPWLNNHSSWIPQPTFGADPGAFSPPMIGYVCDPYIEGSSNNVNGSHIAANMLESAYSWPNSHFAGATHYNHGPGGEMLMRSRSIVTKEARKKRMARYLSLHRNHNQHSQKQNQQHLSQTGADPIVMGSGNCTVVGAGHTSLANWVYPPQAMAGGEGGALVVPTVAAEPVAGQSMDHHQGHASSYWQQMIRDVEARQAGKKLETKKAGKSQKDHHGDDGATTAGSNDMTSSPQPK